MKAIVFGATGMVGEGVLHEALCHAAVESVLVIGRAPCGVSHPKLTEIIHSDFFDFSSIEQHLRGYDACFFCLGVSSIGMTEEKYRRVTYDLTMAAATTLSGLNPGMTFCYISGMGTDSSGRAMWARVKGMAEDHLRRLPFKAVYLFRPGFIKPTPGLKNAFTAARFLGSMYPFLRVVVPKYVCTLKDLGIAMIQSVLRGYTQPVLENKDIARLAATQPQSGT